MTAATALRLLLAGLSIASLALPAAAQQRRVTGPLETGTLGQTAGVAPLDTEGELLPARIPFRRAPGYPVGASALGQLSGPAQVDDIGAVIAPSHVNLGPLAAPNASKHDIEIPELSGTIQTLDPRYQHGYAFDNIYIPGENLSFSLNVPQDRHGVWGRQTSYHFGGAGQQGPRGGEMIYVVHDVPSTNVDPGNPNPFHGALWPFYVSAVNDGGNAAISRGNAYSINPQCQLYAGATFYSTIECSEIDVEVDTGASVRYKFGENITTIGSDNVHGSLRDAALHIGAVPSTGGWNYGIMFSDYSGGGVPISSTGTLLGSVGAVRTIANGIDLRNFTIANLAFASPGFDVDGGGRINTPRLNSSGPVVAADGNVRVGTDPTNGNIEVGTGSARETPYLDLNGQGGSVRMIVNAPSQVEVTGTVAPQGLRVNGTDDAATAWAQTTPSVTPGSGTLGMVTAALRSKKLGRTIFYGLSVKIGAGGSSPAGTLTVSGFQAGGPLMCVLSGRNSVAGPATVSIPPGSTSGFVFLSDNSAPMAAGTDLEVGGVCETAN